ncbi:MAG: SHOCT domain-containing protein [Thermoproteota archaeon]|nr:SHOCT domain-containing protein [Thermoproteota archaeon]
MSLTDNRRKKRGQTTSSSSSSIIAEAEYIVADQVSYNRRAEILEYLKLFGYKPDKTILQVHIVGFFNKRRVNSRSVEQREAASRRYGGTTFVVVGRTHDPSIMDLVIKPKKKREETSPGYVGYLWKSKDPQKKAPHEVIPLDFTPIHVPYPADWKNIFATKGFMVALHVPASFAKHKNKLTRALYRAGKNADVKKPWDFIEEIRSSGNEQQATEDPLSILKIRLATGEISPQEYEKLRQTLTT